MTTAIRTLIFSALLVLPGAAALAGGYDPVKEGRQDFETLCAGCHGADAQGGGRLAGTLSKAPPDLTRIRQRAGGTFDEKAIYDWVIGLAMTSSHGTRDMPVWGDQLLDETLKSGNTLEDARQAEAQVSRRVMGIVRYLETVQAAD